MAGLNIVRIYDYLNLDVQQNRSNGFYSLGLDLHGCVDS